MIERQLSSLIIKELGFEPTNDQLQASGVTSTFLVDYDKNDLRERVLMIRGYAGTGKTSLIGALVRVLDKYKKRSVLLAPTGRAAKVFSFYAKKQASTIHKKIYRQQSGKEFNSPFSVDRNLHKHTIFIVDEASMIGDQTNPENMFGSGNLLADLLRYVYSGEACQLILVGDVAQLPPVGLTLSPALRETVISEFGKDVRVCTLREVIRQTRESGILLNSTRIRTQLAERKYEVPRFKVEGLPDIDRLSGNDFVEVLQDAYQKKGLHNVAVVTRSNKQANMYNQGIRNQVLWYESELTPDDRLMVVKNNYYWARDFDNTDFIANGDFIKIIAIKKYEEKYGFRFADVTIMPEDYTDTEIDVKIILDALISEAPNLNGQQNKDLFYSIEGEYSQIKSKKKRFEAIREDPYYNALQVKYAYAFTCHKSQGGQWDTVFVDPGYFTEDMLGVDYLRWLYTAFTRAQNKLYLVNFKNEFFDEA
ncbi:MAG TPA: AAA family ATPase [Salinivirga sp.]|uniref:ATP-dependent DNA helicase n=1 Tax=Salinivirga sp. TaxID=1970192 RepID=UPI002B46C762|nr:AAA family ATPase [Salinivirga sp.]HKK57964.1 AAA family ATPase [Salinivirga sp.]